MIDKVEDVAGARPRRTSQTTYKDLTFTLVDMDWKNVGGKIPRHFQLLRWG